MIPPAVQRPQARLDLLEQSVYFGEQASVDIAEQYLDAVSKTCALLSQQPHMGTIYESSISRLAGLRRFASKGLRITSFSTFRFEAG
jgi:plasmid stabilization system protein ParE